MVHSGKNANPECAVREIAAFGEMGIGIILIHKALDHIHRIAVVEHVDFLNADGVQMMPGKEFSHCLGIGMILCGNIPRPDAQRNRAQAFR